MKTKAGKNVRHNLRAHGKWLTIIGAAVVFAMFVVKDAYRESLKDISASIAEAQNNFEVASSLNHVLSHLTTIEKEIASERSENNHEITSKEKINDELQSSELDIYNLAALLRAIPDHPDDQTILADARNNITAIRDAVKNPHPGFYQALLSSFVRIAGPLNVSVALLQAQSQIIKDAKQERERREKRVRQCTIASYFLYPIGWIVGLIGKLYGVPEADGGE